MADSDHTPAPPAARPHERRLTVATAYYPARARSAGDRPIPWIRLQGLWLQAAGFHPQQPLRVRIAHGCLVITID
ncbi:MAG: type I toxin-antitoxin system SymE family toxin [Dokdonella sp.]|uniref:SymE family type I addiction module toxin n=1 Tax=Dokdonella sp. TaxID=2291710 RepID=UPI0025C51E3F|nr:SymE family type I addiction module toxin [Dokdonella sp.]MBX3701529.1 type I toxin-antitoxin system SymE family toxin [Dokdonella sp.]